MGCGTSSQARLHPKPTSPAAPNSPASAAVRPAPFMPHLSSSSLSHDSDQHVDPSPTNEQLPGESPSAPAPHSIQPSASPVSGAVTAPLSSSVNPIDSTRSTPSPGAGAARFSLNSYRPHLSPHASNSGVATPSASSTSGSPQQRMSLAAFPMTDEAKAKLDRQRKRHTSTEPNSFSLPPAASPQPPAVVPGPMRASLSRGALAKDMPLSPSRSQRFVIQQRLELEADLVDGLPAMPVSPKSEREMRLSRHASAVGVVGSDSTSVTRLASARSSRRVFDIDGVDGISIAPTTASEADGSDSDRETKDRLERRRTASTRGRFTQTHGARELTVPLRDRRLHNLSADSALMSSDDDDGRRRSLSQPSAAPDAGESARRPRLHLRTTSRISQDSPVTEQPASSDTVPAGTAVPAVTAAESPAAGDNRRGSVVSSQRRMRRFTKTRHSNAFDGTEIASRMSRYDSRGQPINGSISQDDQGWYAAAVAAGAEERDNNHLQVREQPAMTSSSSSDESISPVRMPRGHVRSVSSTGSLSSQPNRLRQRGAAGSSGSYNLAVPGETDRVHRSSQSLAVPQTTFLPSPPTLSPSVSVNSLSPAASYPASAQLSPASHRHQSRGKRLALLYCTPLSSLLLSVSLHKLGYHVLTADTRTEAESLAVQQRFDVVVAEWMDGEAVQLAGTVRAGDEEGERTVVIVVCADGANEDEKARVTRECTNVGCVGVMESGISLLTALPELAKKTVGDGCWFVDARGTISPAVTSSSSATSAISTASSSQSTITQIVAAH